MKRRSQPKEKGTKGTYGRKLANPKAMMYGPTKHSITHHKGAKKASKEKES